jgi:hypothetical protein
VIAVATIYVSIMQFDQMKENIAREKTL